MFIGYAPAIPPKSSKVNHRQHLYRTTGRSAASIRLSLNRPAARVSVVLGWMIRGSHQRTSALARAIANQGLLLILDATVEGE
jgi:hypothetical protein